MSCVISLYLTTTTTQFCTRQTGVHMQYKALAASNRLPMNTVYVWWGRGPHHCTITLSSQCDIPAAGGQIQLLSSLPATITPTTGSPQVLQQSCQTTMHLLEVGGVDGGGDEVGSERRSNRVWCCSLVFLMMSCLRH